MLIKHTLIALGLGIAVGASSVPAFSQDSTEVIAEIGGRQVTAGEVEQKEQSKLLQARYKYYVAEKDALEQYIDEQILELQAKKENITVDELLKRHVAPNVQEPTEDQLRFYYEGVQTDESYDTARPNIIETVHQLRMKKARAAYIADLRQDYSVVVELNQPSAKVEAGNSYRLGSDKAPVQIIEYADYQCPYCQKVQPDLDRIKAQFGDQVSIIYKDFPLPMHPEALRAAEGARCAGVQGKFWEYHDHLFLTKKLKEEDLKEEARTLKLDTDKFDQCMDKQEQFEAVKKDAQDAQHLGLSGTPSFFINGRFMSGAIGYAKLRDTVQLELAGKSPAPNNKQSAAVVPLNSSSQDAVKK
jgi:protein-disulfide isomerase